MRRRSPIPTPPHPAEDLAVFVPSHRLTRPAQWRGGVVFASPHSGATYPDWLLARTPLSAHEIRRNEDIYIDHLFESVVAAGAPLLCANFPRVIVDVNRTAEELPAAWLSALGHDPSPSTPRAAAGLGVVPTFLSESLPIYKSAPSLKDVSARLQQLYHPYHAALSDLLDETLSRFGQALLIDCHSMPGFAPMGSRRPDIILGDRFGTSCHADTLTHAKALFIQAGYSVGINYPYAGGFTTQHYGRPDDGIEALQIEVNRDLYVNPVTLSPKAGYMRLKANLGCIVQEIIARAAPQNLAAQ